MRLTKYIAVGLVAASLSIGLVACDDDDGSGVVDDATEQVETAADAVSDALTGDIDVDMQPQGGSNMTGKATLSGDGDTTDVTLDLENAAGPHPAHIHQGTCADLNPAPKFPLTDVIDGESKTTVDVAIADIRAAPHAINVHLSADDIGQYVACADLPTADGTGTDTAPTTTTTTP